MGGNNTKKTFTEWDLIEYSNITGVPLATVENIYKEFVNLTGTSNRMDKKEFRRLYKQLYMGSQTGHNVAPFLTDQDLDKMSDHVFETYDYDASGKLTFEEFAEIYLMLSHYNGGKASEKGHQRFNYILDQYDTTPGFITRERGQQIFNQLNKYNNLSNWNKNQSNSLSKAANQNWEYHWNKLDDGTGRVPREKFLQYVAHSDEYKHHFNPANI